MSWTDGDAADDVTGPTYPLQRPTFPHYRASFPAWCSVGGPAVAVESLWRCCNGHSVQVASEFCFTCGAPITGPPAAPAAPQAPDKARLLARDATTRHRAQPRPPRTMMWTLLAGAALMAVGVALVAVVVISLI